MLTIEVREWLDRVKRGQYSCETTMSEFIRISRYLTPAEIKMLKKKLEESIS